MDAFGVLGDPVRRRIVEVLAAGERSAGEVVTLVGGEFGIGQSAVSQQLKVLREHGFARVRPEGARRVYALDAVGVGAVDAWLRAVGAFWHDRLDDLASELEGRQPEALAVRPGEAGSGGATRVADGGAGTLTTDALTTGALAAASFRTATLGAITRPVYDLAASEALYGIDGIGLRSVSDATSTNGEHATFDTGGARLVLLRRAAIVNDGSTLTFSVPDLARVVDRLRGLGVATIADAGRSGAAITDDRPAQASFDDAEGRPIVLVETAGR